MYRLKGQPQIGFSELPTIENILAKPNADRKTVEIDNLPNGVYCQILYPTSKYSYFGSPDQSIN